ncbi:MAG: elongation factor P, partial [Bacteroidota bacterium]
MITALELRSGIVIRYNGEFYRVDEFMHRTPGNKRGFMQAKLRNVRNGRVLEVKFNSDEALEDIRVETREFQYLYHDGSFYQLMDKE